MTYSLRLIFTIFSFTMLSCAPAHFIKLSETYAPSRCILNIATAK